MVTYRKAGYRFAVSGDVLASRCTPDRLWQEPEKRDRKPAETVDDNLSGLGRFLKNVIMKLLGRNGQDVNANGKTYH